MKDIGYADEHGIELLVEASGDLLAQQEITKEKVLMEKFFNMLGKQKNKTAYGYDNVKKAIELAAVDTLFLSKKLDKKTISELRLMAEGISANIETVSTDTEEGQQFYNLSGIGAILRFNIMQE
jgi:peptide subunit release factor 1 (eRF1)